MKKSEDVFDGEQLSLDTFQKEPSVVTSKALLHIMDTIDQTEQQHITEEVTSSSKSSLITDKKKVVVSNTFVVGIEQGSSLAYKLSRVAIAQIPMDAKTLPLTVITANDIEAMGYTRQRLTGHMNEIIDDILNYRIKLTQIEKLHNKTTRMTGINVFAQASVVPGKGAIMVQLNPLLIDHFLSLRADFTSYSLPSILKLPGISTPKLHDLLLSRAKKYDTHLLKFKIEDLIVILNYTSTSKSFTPSIFVNNVIKRAVKAINEESELQVEWFGVKTGRACTDIRFYVRYEWTTKEEKRQTLDWEEAVAKTDTEEGKRIRAERKKIETLLNTGKGEVYLFASNNYNTN